MRKRFLAALSLAAFGSLMFAFPALAGEWKQDERGYWYQRTNGTYPTNAWEWIDSDHDGTCERYYFDGDGYCLMNTTTPDGCLVDSRGAWVENGTVQQQSLAYDMSLHPSNGINYSAYQRYGMITRDLTASYLSICDSSGKPLACSYRPQTIFDTAEGAISDVTGTVKLEKNKEYYLEAIITAYSKGSIQLNYPRVASAYAKNVAGMNETDYYYNLDINPLTAVNSVNQSLLKDKQVVEGSMNGDILKNGNKQHAVIDNYGYDYTGICFRSNKFKITDDMPDKGRIEVTPTRYENYYDSNESLFDDILGIQYIIVGSAEDVSNDVKIESGKLSQDYDARGINLTILDMLNSTKEENAAKYTVVNTTSRESYDANFPGITENITYSNGLHISYDTRNRATSAIADSSANAEQRRLYKNAPKENEFPVMNNESKLEDKLDEYAESLGFTYDGHGYIRNDGNKTYNYTLENGTLSLLFNNDDNISIVIGDLGKRTDYYVNVCKMYLD